MGGDFNILMVGRKIIVFSGIVLLAFFISVFINQRTFNLTGEAILGDEDLEGEATLNDNVARTSVNTVVEKSGTCSDSDGGLNYENPGSVEFCENGNCLTESDYCSNGKLNEYYCDDGKIAVERFHKCSGTDTCYNNACRETIYRGGGGGGSSSGGGSGNAAPVVSGETYNWEDSLSFYRVDVMESDSVVFNVLSSEYRLTVSSLSDIVLFSVGSESSNLSAGETKNFDLTGDSVSDISIKLKSVDLINKKAVFDLTRV